MNENDDFWDNDPMFEVILDEKDQLSVKKEIETMEQQQEEEQREFDRIHDAPLRHYKKK
jgi:hypothetical protein